MMGASGLRTRNWAPCFLLFFRCTPAKFRTCPNRFQKQLEKISTVATPLMQMTKNGRTILVGDDEMEVRGYLEMALKCLGYSVEVAQDGDEVLSCLQSARLDISAVLLDIMMPNRDGIDTLREIRRIEPHLPVIIVSGASSTLNVVTAMKGGATDFLCKPIAPDDLGKAVT